MVGSGHVRRGGVLTHFMLRAGNRFDSEGVRSPKSPSATADPNKLYIDPHSKAYETWYAVQGLLIFYMSIELPRKLTSVSNFKKIDLSDLH